ncbi:MAG: hypothetical protein ACLSGI_04405 [Butyricicoccaceae bacterium]
MQLRTARLSGGVLLGGFAVRFAERALETDERACLLYKGQLNAADLRCSRRR